MLLSGWFLTTKGGDKHWIVKDGKGNWVSLCRKFRMPATLFDPQLRDSSTHVCHECNERLASMRNARYAKEGKSKWKRVFTSPVIFFE
jgi:hypothetical protein